MPQRARTIKNYPGDPNRGDSISAIATLAMQGIALGSPAIPIV
jgi:hypothetical protein